MASSSRNPCDLTYFEGDFHLVQPNTLENEEGQANQMDNHLYDQAQMSKKWPEGASLG